METTENIIVKMFKIKSYLKLLHCKTIIFVIQISHGCAYVNRHQFTIIISPKYMCFVILHVTCFKLISQLCFKTSTVRQEEVWVKQSALSQRKMIHYAFCFTSLFHSSRRQMALMLYAVNQKHVMKHTSNQTFNLPHQIQYERMPIVPLSSPAPQTGMRGTTNLNKLIEFIKMTGN